MRCWILPPLYLTAYRPHSFAAWVILPLSQKILMITRGGTWAVVEQREKWKHLSAKERKKRRCSIGHLSQDRRAVKKGMPLEGGGRVQFRWSLVIAPITRRVKRVYSIESGLCSTRFEYLQLGLCLRGPGDRKDRDRNLVMAATRRLMISSLPSLLAPPSAPLTTSSAMFSTP